MRKILPLWLSLVSLAYSLPQEALDADEIQKLCEEVEANPHFRMVRNILTQNHVSRITQNWDAIQSASHLFSHELEHTFSVNDQQDTGRCWLFAALGVLRHQLAAEFEVIDFSFSVSHLYFYDKLERVNYFLELALEQADKPLSDPLSLLTSLSHALEGGDIHEVANLVKKYGLMPDSVYQENKSCENSSQLNYILKSLLAKHTHILRSSVQEGMPLEDVRALKREMLKDYTKILVSHMGTPPSHFDWEYLDASGEIQTFCNLTPHVFAERVLSDQPTEYCSLVHSPRDMTPLYRSFVVNDSTMVIGGTPYRPLNLPIDEIKQIAIEMIKEGLPVYFIADILTQSNFNLGILDPHFFELNPLYQVDFSLEKGHRLEQRLSTPNHAMIFTGVHLVDDKPVRWKVENSWGYEVGHMGHFTMSDAWFDEYVFGIAVPKRRLSPKLQACLEEEAISLPRYDPLF